MADAKKCDRCGKLFEPYIKVEDMRQSKESDNPGYLNILSRKRMLKSQYSINKASLDLCYDCANSFKHWLDMYNRAKIIGLDNENGGESNE